jgi:SAM-dependent methyltransferase
MPSGDEIRDVQRATWAQLSAGWEKWDSVIMDQLAPVSAAIVERLDIADDQQHLDIAAGTGEPGLTVAKLAPRGHVVLTDLSAEMLEVATRRADAQGLTNVETRVCSADALSFDDATFDSVSVRFGYMFFPDLPAATAEFARVPRPGGRLCSGRTCSGARPRDMSAPSTRPRACATSSPRSGRSANRRGSGSRKPSSPRPAPTRSTAR